MTSGDGLTLEARRVGLVLALGGLPVVMDTTSTIVAVPAIGAALHASLPVVQWTMIGYILGVVAVMPMSGWACNRFGDVRVYRLTMTAFIAASAGSCLAWDITSLLVFRVLQGVSGGGLSPISYALGYRMTAPAARGRITSILGLPVVIGPLLGPPLAGWLVEAMSWRWIYGLDVLIGLVALALARGAMPTSATSPVRERLGWTQVLLLSSGAVATSLALAMVGLTGGASIGALAVLVIGAGLLAAWARASLRAQAPLLDLRLLRNRHLAVGATMLVFFRAGYFGAMTVLPIFVQAVRGDSVATAGLLALPMLVAAGITVQVSTRLVDRVPARVVLSGGAGLGAIGAIALLSTAASNAPYALIVSASVLLGVGSGAMLPTVAFSVRELSGPDLPQGTTLLAACQQLAGGLGIASTTTVISLFVSRTSAAFAERDGSMLVAMIELDHATRDRLLPELAAAVARGYGVAAVCLVLAFTTAVVGLSSPRAGAAAPRPCSPTPSCRQVRLDRGGRLDDR